MNAAMTVINFWARFIRASDGSREGKDSSNHVRRERRRMLATAQASVPHDPLRVCARFDVRLDRGRQ
jgi:hypothetical protein